MDKRAAGNRDDLASGERIAASKEPWDDATPQAPVFPAILMDRATLTMLSGPDAGAVFALQSPEVVLGRDADAGLRLDEPTVSRRHAVIRCLGRGIYTIEDLDSRNGTFVRGQSIHSTPLNSGDRVQLADGCAFRFAILDEAEESAQRRLYESAMRDALTLVSNRRYFFERLRSELSHARRERRALSVLLLDIDHFKVVNDTFGHLAGDRALCAISTGCVGAVRAGDLFARYGGEEFAVIARDADLTEAVALAERLRRLVRDLRIEAGREGISLTVSIGVAALSECGPEVEPSTLFARADRRLYSAKTGGRDRVCGVDPPAASK
jgi:two-component system cell cycle response regulator